MKSNLIIIFIIELILLYIMTLAFYYLYLLIKKINLNDRFGKYVIYREKKEIKVFDEIFSYGNSFIKKTSKILYKLKIVNNYSIKYQKYIKKEDKEKLDKMDFVSKKLLLTILFLMIVIIYDLFRYQSITLIQVILSLILGFYILDIFLVSTNKLLIKQKENDLLRAITIMNNSFKSGHSIMQAIKLVSDELDSPLGLEFKKMYVDLTYGLSLDVVFKRFENRVNMNDVKYITTSLTILNNTGGDIVKVFESVEKTFFNNKKLEDELKNLTAASKLLYYVLLFIPILFVLVIYFLDNTYFLPLLSNILGYIIILVVGILYIIYIIIVSKMMKLGDKL